MGQPNAPKLGRGLAGMLQPGAAPQKIPAFAPPEASNAPNPPTTVAVADLIPNIHQPRRAFDEADIKQLADSIRHSGVLQPILVRRSAKQPGKLEIVAGERRWRAARLVGLTEIPAIVREMSDAESAEVALVENLQREDLNPMDRAWGLRRFAETFNLSQAEVAERVGLERSTVANLLRLTELEGPIGDLLATGKLSAGHGKALLAAPAGSSREVLAKQASLEGWSVRETEAAARRLVLQGPVTGATSAEPDPARQAVLEDLERRLGQYLGTKVQIRAYGRSGRGAISIEYYGLDHFDGLLRRIGFDAP